MGRKLYETIEKWEGIVMSGFMVGREGGFFIFFFNDTATTEIYTLSLHDALPIFHCVGQ